MAEATITLYPPITSSWMPAFKQTETIRVYFALSNFNNISEIKYTQIICVSQNTNLSILNRTNYPLGIKMVDAPNIDLARESDDKYYIEIEPADLQDPEMINGDKAFYNNQYYKVQIRLASTEASNWDHNPKTLYAWNSDNLDKLSEWSRVCVIRPIAAPIIRLETAQTDHHDDDRIKMMTLQEMSSGTVNFIPNAFISIQGRLSFSDLNEKETLDHFKFTIGQPGHETYDSGNIYVNSEDPDQIYLSIPYNFQDESLYTLYFTYETSNGYTESRTYVLFVELNKDYDLNAALYVIPDEEKSCMVITLSTDLRNGQLYVDYNEELKEAYAIYNNQLQTLNSTIGGFGDYITILRASNADNFTCWYDIHTEHLANYEDFSYVYPDYTAEAGVLYKYAVQKRNTRGGRGTAVYELEEDPEHPGSYIPARPKVYAPQYNYLVTKDFQLPLKFNGEVSSYKYTVSENSSETIGSQYPFVMRNGNVNYRQFSISGMISTLVDKEVGGGWNSNTLQFEDDEYEINRRAFYGNDYDDYNNYCINNRMDFSNDVIYEKLYRDKVVKFLKDGKPKLFKSTPEGNILVRLMDISLNPEKGLGRMIYSFQAKAIEIADCTIENYEKFDIITPVEEFGGYR